MAELDVKGIKLQLNDDGFLIEPLEWNKDVALALAREQEGLDELSDDHWKVIEYIRNYYLEKDLAPMVRKMCKNTGLSLKEIFALFPSGPAKGACKLAGLPKPDGCV
ncbi:MAG: TusE/DsrC/DsvC family sulfur relay protein [Acidobacteria bacterium]|nr:TusE/DsrC/DsvC family sulfur relay protein [Acidobacteriota bacterium]MBU4331009.1 TusE/DsrC/DsvC family sulfur relay protein [Acidobacteriota bacterium]MBU4494343.1 TusE/DsrC/DsvC family sulfur relay protein [Acidobacteriota bacterium]MCG2815698.1 TusE/DsrC/DsvC family sulfur relay protein [Candidatus Aminicenantes bacterium]